MRHLRELLIDAWSWLNYKQAMAHPEGPDHHAFPELNNSWMPAEELRRLAASTTPTRLASSPPSAVTTTTWSAASWAARSNS